MVGKLLFGERMVGKRFVELMVKVFTEETGEETYTGGVQSRKAPYHRPLIGEALVEELTGGAQEGSGTGMKE